MGGCILQPAVTMPTEERKPLRPRKRLPLSFILGGMAILAAVIYLVYANTQANAVYYMTVSELRNCSTCTTQSVRVAGVVQAGSIVREDQRQLVHFVITEGGQALAYRAGRRVSARLPQRGARPGRPGRPPRVPP